MTWSNPCGGRRWSIHPNGYIQVEGEGFPEYSPGSSQFEVLARTWDNWGALIRRSARRHGIPVSYLLAVATMETGHLSGDRSAQANAVSPAGARGITQVMPFHVSNPNDLFDPEFNLDKGAEILASALEGRDFPAAAAVYNSGRMCSVGRNEWNLFADGNYPRKVIMWNNAALSHLSLSSSVLPLVAGGIVATAAAVAVMIATDTTPKLMHRLGI